LWSLPEFDSPQALREASARWPGNGESLPSFTHTLTHLDWTLHPVRWTLPARLGERRAAALVAAWPSGRWFTQPQALACGLPAPVRKLLGS
jgi:A/G-specific adenine glycosylase